MAGRLAEESVGRRGSTDYTDDTDSKSKYLSGVTAFPEEINLWNL